MMDTRELYQAVIIDHGRHPRNFYENHQATAVQEGHNPLCGDQLKLYLVEKEGVIEEVSFKGVGCAIAMASASLMTECLKGKTRQTVRQLFELFHAMMTQDREAAAASHDSASASDSAFADVLGKLQVLVGVREYPMRVKCATLAWHTLLAALDKSQTVVSTESAFPAWVTLTDKAADYIKNLLKDQPGSVGFRLSLKKSGCSGYRYHPEMITDRDDNDLYVLSSQGIPIYIDAQYRDVLKDTVIDCIDKGLGQKQIVFQNPKTGDACGCGESFKIVG